MKTAIIFGATGQDGFYLNQILNNHDIKTYLTSRSKSPINGNIGDYNFVKELIKKIKPNYIFHFSATSSIKHEFLFENQQSICNGTINIIESVKKFSPFTKVFISGSAEQFKNENGPINEKTEFEANSSYSAQRIYSTIISRYYRKTYNLNIYTGYFFHHDSPFRKEIHLNKKIINFVKKKIINR